MNFRIIWFQIFFLCQYNFKCSTAFVQLWDVPVSSQKKNCVWQLLALFFYLESFLVGTNNKKNWNFGTYMAGYCIHYSIKTNKIAILEYHRTAYYGEYQCYGPGSDVSKRVTWSHQLSPAEASPFITKAWINGLDWLRPVPTSFIKSSHKGRRWGEIYIRDYLA